MAFVAKPAELINSATFHFARAAAFSIVNIYMVKMAGVFMITTSTVAIYTGFAPRWLAVFGLRAVAASPVRELSFAGALVVFPLWVFMISASLLVPNLQRHG